ncbi:DUF4434 domain-containing protein [Candidatus Sumerlaeota bacterium]|nr:DUF4434 domain-containing protein [Candidatus Sumerlaeota bacterium]
MCLDTNKNGSEIRIKDVSHSLHFHYLVAPERRQEYKEVIRQSLINYPKDTYYDSSRGVESHNKGRSAALFTGTFMTLAETNDDAHRFDYKKMEADFTYMRDIGFDIIIALTGVGNKICYPSDILRHPPEVDILEKLLELASEFNFRVFVGLPNLIVDWMIAGEQELSNVIKTSKRVARELVKKYGNYTSFYGWYLPYELCNVFVMRDSRGQKLPSWIGRLKEVCKEVAPDKPVAMAPYFTTILQIEEFEALWDKIFRETGVDIVIMQDGVGIYGEERIRELDAHFAILSNICARHRIDLWADSEVFRQISGIPINDEEWRAVPADFQRLRQQADILARYVSKIVIFCFQTYMSPITSERAEELYRDYKAYYISRKER